MKPLDVYRLFALREMSSLPAVRQTWPRFEPVISRLLGVSPTPNAVFSLGEHLSDVFKAENWTRSQSDLSRAGNMWEILICWYLNLILFGSDGIVLRPTRQYMPTVLREALTVKILGVATDKEADLVAFSLPTSTLAETPTRDDIDHVLRSQAKACSLTVIQSKTNWNDNAQAPMLWDIVYNAQNLRLPTVAVGEAGFSPFSFRNFSYAFVTVPTNTGGIAKFKRETTAVVRVRGLSGGNFWGNPSKPGVADSVSELLGRNFQSLFAGGTHNHLLTNLLSDASTLPKFISFDF